MTSRLRFFDTSGLFMDEISTSAPRSWLINKVGKCYFDVARLDEKTTEALYQFGNYLLVEKEGHEDWIGLLDIDPDQRVWDRDGFVATAYSAEHLFQMADTPLVRYNGTPGAIFKKIVDHVNEEAGLPLVYGEIDIGSTRREETLGNQALEHVSQLATRSGMEWSVTHQLVGSKLYLYANWYLPRRMETGRELVEGHNIEFGDGMLSEQGPIWNIVTGLGDASTDGTRLKITLRDDASISQFGRRRTSVVFSGNRDIETLRQSTQEYLSRMAWPRKLMQPTALNVEDTFSWLLRGNVFTQRAVSAGFLRGGNGYEGRVRLIGKEYEEDADKYDLNTEEVRSG